VLENSTTTTAPPPQQHHNNSTTATCRCVVLKNMFDRLSDEAQSNANYFTELADDVRQECTKMGTVLHAAADKWSNGFVYLKLLAHTEAARVKEVMHGRRARPSQNYVPSDAPRRRRAEIT